jgi:pimeloyl-ACP methyl ester carboxylesterase
VIVLPDAGLPEDGKLPAWLVEKYEKNHQEIWMFDLRGLGETSPAPVPKTPGYFGVDQREAWLALHLNRPLLGQRVLDVLSLLRAIKGEDVQIVGIGSTGPVALHAAALDGRIKEVTLERSIPSWLSVVPQPITYNQLTNAVPGVLKVYDLPELKQSLKSCKVIER